MSGSRVLIIGIIWLSILAFTISAYAGDEIEDLIEIAESKEKIIDGQNFNVTKSCLCGIFS